jgi:NTP pyrophosphatase (non-canonical NTP hydrolase)
MIDWLQEEVAEYLAAVDKGDVTAELDELHDVLGCILYLLRSYSHTIVKTATINWTDKQTSRGRSMTHHLKQLALLSMRVRYALRSVHLRPTNWGDDTEQ